MEPVFRQSMNWLHTWAGVTLGGLLFAIFWMGTLAVFDKEIDRWMAPMTRRPLPETPVPFDALRASLQAAAAAKALTLSVALPTERRPVIEIAYRDGRDLVVRHLDSATGAALHDPGTLAGSRFLYPFHVHLHVRAGQVGYWLVGLAGMAMLVLCISGVIIHRKIFADFFAFRPSRQPRRATLDLHNVAGVLGLPFHLAIALSGLIAFYAIYFPSGWQAAYPDRQAFNADAYGTYARPKSDQPGKTVSFDTMVTEARRLWGGDAPRNLVVVHPGDAASYVAIYRPYERHVAAYSGIAYFDAGTGALLHYRSEPRPVMTAQRFVAGLHLIQFRHWTLRWLYFALGLSGCVVIATGYLFWLESRRKTHARLGLPGVRIVEGLTVGSVAGIVVATLSFFVVNRLLPPGASVLGQGRAALEVWAFYLVWLAAFGHAWLRPERAWIEQCFAIAAFAVAAVLLNWVTTGHHLIRSVAHAYLRPVAGMDLLLLAGAAVAVLVARKLLGRASAAPACHALAHVAETQAAE
jgi:uncharacterized iron-regulated membrane protein